MSSKTSNSQTPVHAEYRNGTYYGMMPSSAEYKRHGKGLLILDSSTVLFADWKENSINGCYVYITDQMRAYGQIIQDRLEGLNVITMTQSLTTREGSSHIRSPSNYSSASYSSAGASRTFYAMYRSDKIYGKAILIQNDTIIVMQFNNNELQQILMRKSIRQKQALEVLSEIFPSNCYSLDDYLTQFIKNSIAEIEQIQEISRFQPCISFFPDDQKFYGFQESLKPNRKFGLLMIGNQIVSIGDHENSLLQGVGRMYLQDHVLDGVFYDGVLDGIGVDYTKSTNKFLLGEHSSDNLRTSKFQKGFGFPLRQILEIRKQFHLRSIYFYNDIAILGLKNKFEGQINQILMHSGKRNLIDSRQQDEFTHQSRYRSPFANRNSRNSRSHRKIVQNSPLKKKLHKYQEQEDYIQDHSPIKTRGINQYKPVGVGRGTSSKYFNQPNSQQNNYLSREHLGKGQSSNQDRFYGGRGNSSRFSHTGGSPYYEDSHEQNENYRRAQYKAHDSSNTHSNDRFSRQQRSSKKQERENQQRSTYQQILRKGGIIAGDQLRRNESGAKSIKGDYEGNRSTGGMNRPEKYNEPYNQYRNPTPSRSRKNTKELMKELDRQEQGKRDVLDQIYRKSGIYGRR